MSDYAHVESITLSLKFTDADDRLEPSHKELEFRPRNTLNLKIECPFVSCVSGGFDITGQIERGIRNRETVIQLNDTCYGWQDSRRIGKNRCLCELDCNVAIIYRNA